MPPSSYVEALERHRSAVKVYVAAARVMLKDINTRASNLKILKEKIRAELDAFLFYQSLIGVVEYPENRLDSTR